MPFARGIAQEHLVFISVYKVGEYLVSESSLLLNANVLPLRQRQWLRGRSSRCRLSSVSSLISTLFRHTNFMCMMTILLFLACLLLFLLGVVLNLVHFFFDLIHA